MKKSEVNRFTSKLYRLLEGDIEIQFRRMKNHRGLIWPEELPIIIRLDPASEIIPTLIHEVCHAFYPKLSEREILEKEHLLMAHLSERQTKNILKKLAKNL